MTFASLNRSPNLPFASRLLCATALALAAVGVTGLSGTAAHAQAAASPTADAWAGTWGVNDRPNGYMLLHFENTNGKLSGRYEEGDHETGKRTSFPYRFVFDLKRSTPQRLYLVQVGRNGDASDIELALQADGLVAHGVRKEGGEERRFYLQRLASTNAAMPRRMADADVKQALLGPWETPFGRLVFTGGGPRDAYGSVDTGTGDPHRLHLQLGSDTDACTWNSAQHWGSCTLSFAPDAKSFQVVGDGSAPFGKTWTAVRLGEEDAVGQPGAGPLPPAAGGAGQGEAQPPASPLPPAPSPAPEPAPAAYQQLRKFDVRLDKVAAARDAQRVDVFLTLRNGTAQPQYVPSGTLMVGLEDSAGVGKQNGQVLRPTAEGQVHFGSTPVLQPGRELKVKFSFYPDAGTTPAKVFVAEGDKTAEFPAQAL